MKGAKMPLALFLTTILAIEAAYSLVQRSRVVHNHAAIKTIGVGVFWDQACTLNVTSIEWGMLEPGEQKNVTVYVRSEGNTPGSLSMITDAWQPENASEFITLTWTAEGLELDPGEVSPVVFTLTVAPSISGIRDFSFDITIWIRAAP